MSKQIVVYESFDGFSATSLRNYKSYVMDAHKVMHFKTANGFKTMADVLDYMCTYLGFTDEDFVPRPY